MTEKVQIKTFKKAFKKPTLYKDVDETTLYKDVDEATESDETAKHVKTVIRQRVNKTNRIGNNSKIKKVRGGLSNA